MEESAPDAREGAAFLNGDKKRLFRNSSESLYKALHRDSQEKGLAARNRLPSKALLLLPCGHTLPMGHISNPRRFEVKTHRLP